MKFEFEDQFTLFFVDLSLKSIQKSSNFDFIDNLSKEKTWINWQFRSKNLAISCKTKCVTLYRAEFALSAIWRYLAELDSLTQLSWAMERS